jgi:transcriptional regulator with XRE-family HTH domain
MGAMRPENVRIGKRIADLRQDHGWSKADLARRSGVTPSYVTRVERGEFDRPSIEKISAIATALRVSVTALTDPADDIPDDIKSLGFDQDEVETLREIALMVADDPPALRKKTLEAFRVLVRRSSGDSR